jgi:hypothetical protein
MTATTQPASFPTPAHELLGAFAGVWRTSGMMPAQSGPVMITGIDTYEWLPGGYFLLHTVDVTMGEERRRSTEIIGCDNGSGSYVMYSFDDRGNITLMKAGYDQGTWTFQGDALRFTGSFDPGNKVISGVWERLEEGHWVHLMNIRLSRQRI